MLRSPGKRIMPAWFMSVVLFLFPLGLFGQVGSWVEGVVSDGQTGVFLTGATVGYGEGRGTLTGSDGHYRVSVAPGELRLIFRYVGYREEVVDVLVPAGDTLRLNIMLFQQATEMERVVVSAGRVSQRVADLTVSMSLIRPESIAATHTTDAQDLISRAPGIEVLDGQASIRGGSGFSYGAGSRVMVLIDGLPMLSADAGHVRWQSLPLENISQVEIIKGAASVMYGSSALNGIINFRTAEATTAGVTSFYAETGLFGRPARKDWIWWNTPRVYTSASASHLKKYGNTDIGAAMFLQFDNGYRRLNEDHYGRLNLSVRHHDQKVTGLSYGLALNAMHNRKHDFILWEDGTTGALKQDTSSAQHLYGTHITFDPVVSYHPGGRFSHDFRNRLQFTQNYYPEGGANNSDAESWYSEYQFGYRMSQKLVFSSGLTQIMSRVRSPFYGNHTGWNGGAYAQAEFVPINRLKVVAGTRLEMNTLDGDADKLVPLFRTGVNYRAADVTFVRASFGQGYRYPSIAEKHAATTLGSVKIIPNPNIRPESGWTAEAGVKQGVATKWFRGIVDFALFYSQNASMIEYLFGIYPGAGFGFRATNIEHSRVYGAEVEWILHGVTGAVSHTLAGGYVWMYPVEFNPATGKNTGQYLKFRRKHAFTFNVTSTWRKVDFSLQAVARSPILDIDRVFLDPTTREDLLPGFYDYWMTHNKGHLVMDFAVARPLSHKYKISLAIRNFTNTEYMGRPGDIRPHRHLSLRLTGGL
jgi:outer membrane receptor protein involved in Fe transport